MAVTFTLSDGTTTIDLTDTTENIFLQEADYVPVVATPTGDGTIPPYVIETLPVGLHSATYNGYCTLLQNVAALQKRAAEFWVNRQQSTPVWLTCKLDAEGTARRALVKAIHFEWRDPGWQEWLYQECAGSAVPTKLWGTLLVERHPWWEQPTLTTMTNESFGSGISVLHTPTADGGVVLGDVPARIAAFGIKTNTGSISLTRFWLGIRSTAMHVSDGVTAFLTVWECEDGTDDDADVADDAASEPNTASPGGGGGSFKLLDPARAGGSATDWDDGTFYAVTTLAADTAGYADAEDAFGRFLWLLRAKVSAGTWEVQFRSGYAGTGSVVICDPVEISNTSWDLYEVGTASFPPRDMRVIPSASVPIAGDLKMQVQIFARRTSGAGTLSLDCYCPIPTDEGFLKIPDGYATTTVDTIFCQGPNDAEQAITFLSGQNFTLPTFEAENFHLQPGTNRIVVAYARASSSVLADSIEFGDTTIADLYYTARWTALRGAE